MLRILAIRFGSICAFHVKGFRLTEPVLLVLPIHNVVVALVRGSMEKAGS